MNESLNKKVPDQKSGVFFYDTQPEPKAGFIGWVDLMGAANHMLLSLRKASIFISKIHAAGLIAQCVHKVARATATPCAVIPSFIYLSLISSSAPPSTTQSCCRC